MWVFMRTHQGICSLEFPYVCTYLQPPPSPENEWDSDEEEDGLADQTPLDYSW